MILGDTLPATLAARSAATPEQAAFWSRDDDGHWSATNWAEVQRIAPYAWTSRFQALFCLAIPNIVAAGACAIALDQWTTGATENAAISARLPYILASSRFAHYLKVMGRDKIGSFMEVEDVQNWLNRWILNYVNSAEGGGQEMRAKFPLRDARVEVAEVPGSPGSYNAVAYLRPWLQMEELTASLRLVARIPQKS